MPESVPTGPFRRQCMKQAGIAAQAAWVLFLLLCAVPHLNAQEKGGPPPALVSVSEVREGTIAPRTEFVGTVFYPEVSEVSAEVSGGIVEVRIEEGQRARKGDALVLLDSELLQKTLASTRASHGQVLVDLEKAKLDFQRVGNLYREDAIAEQVYDENRFRVKSLEKKAESLQAEMERLEAELRKKTIRAPFDGVIVKKLVDPGEWLSPGDKVASLARNDSVDVIVEVPGEVVGYARPGRTLDVKVGGAETKGTVVAVVPRGDIATRTFPVKVRVRNRYSLIEGMEARVSVPTGKSVLTLLVSRDAVVTVSGNTAVYAVEDGKAKMVPVKVLQYEGGNAGIEGNGLRKGMTVVVKGNERLRDGQPVRVVTGQGTVSGGGEQGGPPR